MMASYHMSYIHSPVKNEMPYFTIPERLKELGNELQDKEIYVFVNPDEKRVSITAFDLLKASTDVAKRLVKLGIKRGDVVANCIPNNLESLICTFGVICAGGAVLNLIISQTNLDDIKAAIIKTGAKGLILDPGNDNTDLNAFMKFIEENKGDGHVSSNMIPSLDVLLTTKDVQGGDVINVMKQGIDTSGVTLPLVDPEDIAVFFTTSGSTGASKFVPQSHHAAMLVCNQLKESMIFDPVDVIYCERRIAWLGGFPYIFLHNDAKTVTKTKPFASLNEHCVFTAKVLEEENCTIACFLPATIVGLVDIWNKTKSPRVMLKNIHVGGLPVADVCMDAIGRYTKAVTVVYGSSEAGYLTGNTITNKVDFDNYCCGIPCHGVEIKVLDEVGFVVPRGETGNIYARSPSLFWQYCNDQEKTNEALSCSHWMDTDDVGFISKDGKLTVSGRKSDLILQSGKYFIPSQVEAFIKSHPDVLDAIVVSIPDPAKFALVCACVIGKAGHSLTMETVRDYLATKYRFAAGEAFSSAGPEHVLIYEDYPRLYTGKPNKILLREDAIERLKQQK